MFKIFTRNYKKNDMKKLLDNYCKKNKWEYLSNITIKFEEQEIEISHLIIGKFGVLILDDLDYTGDLYGSQKDRNWALHEKDYKSPISNPVKKLVNQEAILRRIFPKEEIYRIEIEKYIVFLKNPKKLVFYSNVKNCIYFNDFKKIFTSARYLEDRNVEIKKVKECILKYSNN